MFRCSSIAMAILIALIVGCTQEMANQPRYNSLAPSTAFSNGASARHPVIGTIARGQLQLDDTFFIGKVQNQFVTELPDRALKGTTMTDLLTRGQQRFDAFCSHCHGQVGGGVGGDELMQDLVGMVVKRGFPSPPTFHQERLRELPIGYFFDVITNGFGRMPAHNYMIPPEDRWAIVAYIRALQLSQHAEVDQLPATDVQKLKPRASGE